MKNPVRVAVTGAAGQIGYALLFRIAAGVYATIFTRPPHTMPRTFTLCLGTTVIGTLSLKH